MRKPALSREEISHHVRRRRDANFDVQLRSPAPTDTLYQNEIIVDVTYDGQQWFGGLRLNEAEAAFLLDKLKVHVSKRVVREYKESQDAGHRSYTTVDAYHQADAERDKIYLPREPIVGRPKSPLPTSMHGSSRIGNGEIHQAD
jgi:hypothetical protein